MNDEIKEILDFKENSKKDEATKQLVDYITNLQQENERLKDQNINEILKKDLEICAKQYKKSDEKVKKLEKRNKEIYEGFLATQEEMSDYAEENEKLKSRIEKAVEYIKENEGVDLYDDVGSEFIRNLLNILEGRSDE